MTDITYICITVYFNLPKNYSYPHSLFLLAQSSPPWSPSQGFLFQVHFGLKSSGLLSAWLPKKAQLIRSCSAHACVCLFSSSKTIKAVGQFKPERGGISNVFCEPKQAKEHILLMFGGRKGWGVSTTLARHQKTQVMRDQDPSVTPSWERLAAFIQFAVQTLQHLRDATN